MLVRFGNGARGCVTVGQVCAGHKNDLWFEANGQRSSLRWHQERQNELWLGRRDGPNGLLPKDPSLLLPAAQPYAHLPGGHQEAWADAFRNVLHDVYTYIADGGPRSAGRPAGVPHLRGRLPRGRDRRRHSRQPPPRRRMDEGRPMKLGVFSPVFGTLDFPTMLARVRALGHLQAIELATGGWPGRDHMDPDALLADTAKAQAFAKTIADAGLTISALSCHNNPLHPDAGRGAAADDTLRKTIQAGRDAPRSGRRHLLGCPGDFEGARHPNWVTAPWPPEFAEILDWQWEKKAIPVLARDDPLRRQSTA